MNKTQAIDYARIIDTLRKWGFDRKESDTLFRVSHTLRKWFEQECGVENGHIERDEKTGKPFFRSHNGFTYSVRDNETGARKRLAKIMTSHVAYAAYVQTDPRGCALYIAPVSELSDGANVDSVYTRGLAICY